MQILIDEEFKALIPPLKQEELAQLEQNILADGCRDPLVIWRGVLIDGHNRFSICQKNSVSFGTVSMDFESRDAVKIWILKNQFGRRNLTDYQRTELALLLKPLIEEQARAHQGERTDIRQNSDEGSAPIRTDETIASMAGVSRDTVRKVEAIQQNAAPEVVQAARTGEISIHLASQVAALPVEEQAIVAAAPVEEIKEVAREVIRNHRAIGTGENEWYTPEEYAEMARQVMGSIDLDPASNDEANQVIKASRFLTKEDDGLKHDWRGNVWCNPPYSRDLMPLFVEKLRTSYESGDVQQSILLSHNNTDTAWFHNLASVASAICFPKKRIKFYRGEDIAAPTNGQAFFYLGNDVEAFKDVFCSVGFVVAPI